MNITGKTEWKKDVERDSRFVSAALTPGGEYAIVARGRGSSTNLSLAVYTSGGAEITPQFRYSDVRLVEANDRGMFFTQTDGHTLHYYQIGTYTHEYQAEGTGADTTTTSLDLEGYDPVQKKFVPLSSAVSWDTVYPSATYKATKEITFLTSWGSITIGNGTIFSKSTAGEPMLIEGYIHVDADTPITMVILKNKLTDISLMAKRVLEYWLGRLSPDSYIVVKNLHTRYTAQKHDAGISIAAQKGTIEVTISEKTTTVPEGSVAHVDANGGVSVKKQASWRHGWGYLQEFS